MHSRIPFLSVLLPLAFYFTIHHMLSYSHELEPNKQCRRRCSLYFSYLLKSSRFAQMPCYNRQMTVLCSESECKSSLHPKSTTTVEASSADSDGKYFLTLCSRTCSEPRPDSERLAEVSRSMNILPFLSHPLRSINESAELSLCQFQARSSSDVQGVLTAAPARYGWPDGVGVFRKGPHLFRVLLAADRKTFRRSATHTTSI